MTRMPICSDHFYRGDGDQECCQTGICVSALLPFRVHLASWAVNSEKRVRDLWKYLQAAWTTKTGKTKHFLPGASDSLLRGHSWLSCESLPQNTVNAIRSVGLALQAGNNLGNSHLQVGGGWQHACSLTGNEGRDEKEHGFDIALIHAVESGAEGLLCSSHGNNEDFFCVWGVAMAGKVDANREYKEKVQRLGEKHENSCHCLLSCLFGRVREKLWCISHL